MTAYTNRLTISTDYVHATVDLIDEDGQRVFGADVDITLNVRTPGREEVGINYGTGAFRDVDTQRAKVQKAITPALDVADLINGWYDTGATWTNIAGALAQIFVLTDNGIDIDDVVVI